MRAVAYSGDRVLVAEISADRKRHTKRGYLAVVFVTVLGAAFSSYFNGGIFETLIVAVFALASSTITAAIINTDHHIYYRAVSFSSSSAAPSQMVGYTDSRARKRELENAEQSSTPRRPSGIDQIDENDRLAIKVDEDIFRGGV
jgi:hypothetical protein